LHIGRKTTGNEALLRRNIKQAVKSLFLSTSLQKWFDLAAALQKARFREFFEALGLTWTAPPLGCCRSLPRALEMALKTSPNCFRKSAQKPVWIRIATITSKGWYDCPPPRLFFAFRIAVQPTYRRFNFSRQTYKYDHWVGLNRTLGGIYSITQYNTFRGRSVAFKKLRVNSRCDNPSSFFVLRTSL